MMKILILTSRFGSGYGMGYATFKEATAFVNLGHSVTVVYCNPDPNIDEYRDNRINFQHLKINKIPFIGLALFRFTLRSFFKKLVQSYDFDIIYIQSLEFGWLNFKKIKIPVYYFVRSTILGPQMVLRKENTPVSILGLLTRMLLIFLEKRCLYYSRTVFVKAPIMIEEVSKLYGINKSKIVVINGGIDIKDFSVLPKQTINSIKTRLNIPSDAFVILYAGRIVPQKGLKYLIEASFKLFSQLNIVVIVAGASLSKSYAAKMKELVAKSRWENKFYFLDHVDQLQISPIFNIADCLVTPSLYEPFGMVNLQAAFLDKYIITTKAVGSIELLANYPKIKIVEAGSSDVIAEAIQHLIQKKHELSNEKGILFDFNRYSWKNVAQQLIKQFGITN